MGPLEAQGTELAKAMLEREPQRPGRTATYLALDLVQSRALSALARRMFSRSKPIVDAIDANQGAKQLALAGRWAEILTGNRAPQSGYAAYTDRFQRDQIEQGRRK